MKKKHLFLVGAKVRIPVLLSLFLNATLAFVAQALAQPAQGTAAPTNDLTMAMPNGDLLRADGRKLFLRWGGLIAGASMSQDGEPIGGGLLLRDRGMTAAQLFERVAQPRTLPPQWRALAQDGRPAAWVCTPSVVKLVLSPDPQQPEVLILAAAPSPDVLGLVPGLSEAARTGQAKLVACAADEHGKLFVVYRSPPRQAGKQDDFYAATPLEGNTPVLLNRTQCSSHEASGACTLGLTDVTLAFVGGSPETESESGSAGHWRVISRASLGAPRASKAVSAIQGSSTWLVHDFAQDLSSERVRTWSYSLAAEEEAKPRITARGDAILAWNGQDLSLTRLHSSSDAVLRPERLPVSPCSERQLCGLSLAADGTWAAAGFWGAYAGRGALFRRIDAPLLVDETGRLDVAHSGVPGDIALFGSDDASIERIGFELPQPLRAPQWPQTAASLRAKRRAVVWLKPGQAVKPHEEPLFELKTPLGVRPRTDGHKQTPSGLLKQESLVVALTFEGFDPTRHLAYETEVEVPALETKERPHAGRPGALEIEGNWWHEALQSRDISELLRAADVTPEPVTVALLDSGADLEHADFHPFPEHTPQGPSAWQTNSATSGTSDTAIGHDFVDEDDVPQDLFGHGTHVSGLAKPAFSAFASIRLLVVRVLDAQGKSNSIAIGRGFLYAARLGASLINASWGGGPRTQFMADAIKTAQQAGALVVTSAGNDRLNIDRDPPVPSHLPRVVSVGAMNEQGRRAPFSNFGKNGVFLFSPGSSIASLALGGGTRIMSGTSMAAPLFVAHVAAALGVARHLNHYAEPDDRWQSDLLQRFCAAAKNPVALEARRDRLNDVSQCGALRPLAVFEGLLSTPLASER